MNLKSSLNMKNSKFPQAILKILNLLMYLRVKVKSVILKQQSQSECVFEP
jgi:hypothetical protein